MIQIEPILYIGISQSFFAGMLVSTKKPFTTANKIMAAWLFLLCIELIFALINTRLLPFYSFPFIAFTYGPLLYLYSRHITMQLTRFSMLNLLHFIPFLVFFGVSVWLRDYQLFKNPLAFFRPDGMITLRIVYGISFFISVSLYSILTFIVIRKHQIYLKDNLSFTSLEATLNWLKIISISFYSVYLILFILGGINIIGNYIPFDPYYIIFIFIALLSFALSFYGVRQPELFTYNAHESVDTGEVLVDSSDQERYVRSGLKPEQARELLGQLVTAMKEKKYYLDRDLSVYDLSELTGISRHHITQILNEEYGHNFYTFINEFRLKEAAERLRSHQYRNYTILAIAYDSGFNSKSAFNKVFKDVMGMTPSEYREKA